jgi:hypothetical protein
MVKKKTPPRPPRRAARPESSRGKIAAAVLLLALALVALRWNTFTSPFERDEGEYAYGAWLIRQGILPYQNAFMQKPPMVLYTYLVAQGVSPSVWAPHVLGVLFLGGALAGLAVFARCELGPGAGFAAAALAVPMRQFSELAPFAANTEAFMLLPLMGVFAVYSRARGESETRAWFAAGVLAALAILYKPICLFVLAVLAAVWLWESCRALRSIGPVAVRAAAGLAGGAAASLAALGWFLARDGGRSLWEATVRFNSYYARFSWDVFVIQVKILAPVWWPLPLLWLWFAYRRPARLWFYLALLAGAWLGVCGSLNLHYVLLIVPFLALLGAAAIQGISAHFELGSWTYGVVVAAAAILAWPVGETLGLTPDQVARKVYSQGNPFVESEEIARRVAALTQPNDLVYVAGSEPQILYHAQRRSPTRFVIAYPMTLDTPLALPYQQECIRDLEARPPEVVVFVRAPFSWLQQPNTPGLLMQHLTRMVNSDYRLVGGFVPDAVRGKWEEPIAAENREKASMLVFQRLRGPADPAR